MISVTDCIRYLESSRNSDRRFLDSIEYLKRLRELEVKIEQDIKDFQPEFTNEYNKGYIYALRSCLTKFINKTQQKCSSN